MKLITAAVSLGILVITAGCGARPIWLKDGATAQDFERDRFDCEHKVVTMYGGYGQMGAGHAILAKDDMIRCMQAQGYRQATAEERKLIEEKRRGTATQ